MSFLMEPNQKPLEIFDGLLTHKSGSTLISIKTPFDELQWQQYVTMLLCYLYMGGCTVRQNRCIGENYYYKFTK